VIDVCLWGVVHASRFVAVAAPYRDDLVSFRQDVGVVYIFRTTDGGVTWPWMVTMNPTDYVPTNRLFGLSISMHLDVSVPRVRLMVGSPGSPAVSGTLAKAGLVYLYQYNYTTAAWSLEVRACRVRCSCHRARAAVMYYGYVVVTGAPGGSQPRRQRRVRVRSERPRRQRAGTATTWLCGYAANAAAMLLVCCCCWCAAACAAASSARCMLCAPCRSAVLVAGTTLAVLPSCDRTMAQRGTREYG
jgi:hypothetical protein